MCLGICILNFDLFPNAISWKVYTWETCKFCDIPFHPRKTHENYLNFFLARIMYIAVLITRFEQSTSILNHKRYYFNWKYRKGKWKCVRNFKNLSLSSITVIRENFNKSSSYKWVQNSIDTRIEPARACQWDLDWYPSSSWGWLVWIFGPVLRNYVFFLKTKMGKWWTLLWNAGQLLWQSIGRYTPH